MNKKNLVIFLIAYFCCIITGNSALKSQEIPHRFRDPEVPVDERIENLLGLLTLEEKVGLMMNSSKPVARLGIPAYDWWNEALHGVARSGKATVFPQAIGMAATWNESGHKQTFDIISDEARAKYNEAVKNNQRGRYYGLSFWTPNINIFRDPRWGRGQETYGEDPYLTARLGIAAVKGLQGNDPKYFKTHACAKHFAVHSGPEWNRHSYNAITSGRDLWETYLLAFKALVKEANVQEVMCAYNAFDGQPCCGSDRLLTDILRNRWEYKGIVVSDCWAIDDFFKKGHHETHADAASASADAVIHSTDLECGSAYASLLDAVKQGFISQQQIDVSLRRVLRGWFELGMLDPADRLPWNSLSYNIVASDLHIQQALKVARESMTLLKNERSVLPLSKKIKKIAVIGPNAADSIMLWGNYNGTPTSTVTILQGIKNKLPETEVIYDKGSDWVDPWVRTSLYEGFSSLPERQKGLKVEFFNNTELSGSPEVTVINSLGIDYNNAGGTALAQGVNLQNTSTRISGIFTAPYTAEITFKASASDGYILYVDGKAVLTKKGRESTVGAEYTMKAEKGRKYNIVLEHKQIGRYVNIGFSVFKKDKADFTALAKRLKDVDAIIYVGGLSPQLEGEEMPVNAEGFRGGDKVSIDLPKIQKELLASLKTVGKPLVFVLCTGSSLALEQDEKNYDALLCAWYGGQEAGTAVADVLFGDYNPAGRLPVTFYKSLDQLDHGLLKTADVSRQGFENYSMQGRTYRYMNEKPLYPFGYGLSYSQFEYGDVKLEADVVRISQGLRVGVPVTNVSSLKGEEVIQLYVKRNGDPDAPVKSLKGFRRTAIAPGETQIIDFELSAEAFEFYDPSVDGLVPKAGNYTIMYGSSSDEGNLKSVSIRAIL